MAVAPPTSLPRVVLKDVRVPAEVLQLVPLETVEKYQVVAFESTPDTLKLALVHPEQLKQGFYVALDAMSDRIKKKIELYQTDGASLKMIIKQYQDLHADEPVAEPATPPSQGELSEESAKTEALWAVKPVNKEPAAEGAKPETQDQAHENMKPSPLSPVKNPPYPPLFSIGQTVAYNYLHRIPFGFAKQHRIVGVDYEAPNHYWFVTDGTNDKELKTILPFIERQNNVKAYVFQISRNDFNSLLSFYEALDQQENSQRNDEAKTGTPEVKKEEPEAKKEPGVPLMKEEKVEEKKESVEEPATASAAAEEKVEEKPETKVEEKVEEKPEDTPEEPKVEDKKEEQASESEPTLTANDATKQASKIEPDVQATILSTEEEKGGLAGLFQKMAHGLSAKQEVDITDKPKPDELVDVEDKEREKELKEMQLKKDILSVKQVASISGADDAPSTALRSGSAAERPGDEEIDIGKLLDKEVESLEELKTLIQKGFIPQIVAATINFAIHEKASDVHLEAFDDEVRIRYRVDGLLFDVVKLPYDIHAAMVSRIKILSRLRLDENRVPQDGRFDVQFRSRQVDVRVSVMPTVHGEKVVMRLLDKSQQIASLEQLGIEGLAYASLNRAIQKPYGIVLATGPTGSGKSTSLYAVLNRIATPHVNVVTLEDPVEYEVKGINQSQVRPKIGYTFAEGLRSVLRQDPNIIMVGEIRDGETANMATQAALTGHLVLSTLHTNDASGAIPRLTNMGIEPFLITSSLNVAMGQRLVRRICNYCKQEVNMPDAVRDKFAQEIEEIEKLNPEDAKRIKRPFVFQQGVGCDKCNGKGYQGRVGIFEVMVMSDAIEDLTMQRATNLDLQNQAQKEGMLTMYQDGLIKVINGLTTLDEVLRETSNK